MIDDDDEHEQSPERRAFEQLRVLSCDLAEHVVERLGAAQGFAVWRSDGDVQSFTPRAQEAFDRLSGRIEVELVAWRAHGDDDAVVAALADVFGEAGADVAVIARVLARL